MLLVARTAAALPRTVATLARHGWAAEHILPFALLETAPLPFTLPETTQAVLITSAAALAALPVNCPLPLHCVGDATAQTARAQGFTVATAGTGDGAALARQIVKTQKPQNLVHLVGPRSNHTWYTILRDAGFKVLARKAYTTRYVKNLPQPVRDALISGKITCLMVFSPRAGQVLAGLFDQAGAPKVPVVAISRAAAAAFDG